MSIDLLLQAGQLLLLPSISGLQRLNLGDQFTSFKVRDALGGLGLRDKCGCRVSQKLLLLSNLGS